VLLRCECADLSLTLRRGEVRCAPRHRPLRRLLLLELLPLGLYVVRVGARVRVWVTSRGNVSEGKLGLGSGLVRVRVRVRVGVRVRSSAVRVRVFGCTPAEWGGWAAAAVGGDVGGGALSLAGSLAGSSHLAAAAPARADALSETVPRAEAVPRAKAVPRAGAVPRAEVGPWVGACGGGGAPSCASRRATSRRRSVAWLG
jgi:hypothetical protein